MKLPLLLTTVLLTAMPALASKTYKGGVFKGENYVMTFYRSDHAEDLYSVSVVEPRSAKQYGYIVPSSFSFDCAKGKGSGFVAMGINRSQDFIVDVVKFYLLEFCTRNGYQYEDQVK